jgi:hypothetical protein
MVALAGTPNAQPVDMPTVLATAPTTTPDPYAIFVTAMRAMRAAHTQPTPSYLAYKLDVDTHNLQINPGRYQGKSGYVVTIDHANHHYAYQVWYRARDGTSLSQDLTTHEAVSDTLFEPAPVALDEVSSPSPKPVVAVASTASPKSTQSPNAGVSPAPGFAAPPSLGTLSVSASRYYRITFVALEPIDESPTYHVHLVALADATQHPLTDLWVDTSTYLIRKASAAFTFRAVAAGAGGQGSANFARVDKSWMVTSFDGAVKGYALVWHANVAIAIRAYDIMPLAYLPDSYFSTPSPRASR